MQRTTADSADWEQTIEGDVLTIEQTLVDALGRALDRARAFPRALTPSDWSRIRRLSTTSAEALDAYSEARALLDRYDVPGNVDRAIGLLTRATATDPKFAEAYAALGDAQWIRYQYLDKRSEVAARATAAVMEALRIDPEAAPVYYSLGNMQYRTGQYESAVASLRRAIELQPDADDPHRLLGLVLAAKGDVDAAVVELHRAIDMLPRWNNYMSLGYALHTAGRYNDAIDALRKAIELQPSNSEAYQLLGTTYHMIGDLPQAIGNTSTRHVSRRTRTLTGTSRSRTTRPDDSTRRATRIWKESSSIRTTRRCTAISRTSISGSGEPATPGRCTTGRSRSRRSS